VLLRRNQNFRLLFGASGFSNLADGVALLAFPWLASLLTRDPFLISLVAAAGRLPWLLFTAPAGVLADRLDRRRLMVLADAGRAIVAVLVVALVWIAPLEDQAGTRFIWVLAGLAFILGMAEVLKDNTAQTALPSVVDSADLETANGQMWSLEQVIGTFAGPPLAGILIAWAVPAPFQLIAILFALAAFFVARVQFPPRKAAPVTSPWQDFKDGARWLWRHKTVLKLGILLGCINGLTAGFVTLYVLISQDILGLNAFQHGLLMMAAGIGGVIGGIAGPKLINLLGAQVVFIGAQITFLIEPITLSFSSNVWMIGSALAVAMFAAVSYNVVTVSYRQREIPDALLGRVNALFRLLGWGVIPIGTLITGAVVSWLEPSLGREAALRAPIMYSAFGLLAMIGFSALFIRVSEKKTPEP